jgi:uncharacterized RDD family membrane protein YckC
MMAGELPSLARRHGDYAGFVTRLAAFVLDRIIITLILAATAFLADFLLRSFQLGPVFGFQSLSQQIASATAGVAASLFNVAYDVGFWMLAGQTPGKRIMGVLIVRTDGGRVKLGTALLRWVGYWFSGILFLGYLWILVDSRRQGFHDKLARTLVIYAEPEAAGFAAPTPIRDRLGGLGQESGHEGRKAN